MTNHQLRMLYQDIYRLTNKVEWIKDADIPEDGKGIKEDLYQILNAFKDQLNNEEF